MVRMEGQPAESGFPVDTRIIEPPTSRFSLDLRELWAYRELLYFFIWRDVKVRYKQTMLGFLWALIQPLFMMLIFTIFFGRLARIPSENIPYPLFCLVALLPWQFFAEGIARSTTSIVNHASLMTKVYFPRILLPLAGILSPLIDLSIAFTLLAVVMFYFGVVPGVTLLLLPIFVILALITSFAVGVWLSALNVYYRDFQYSVPFLIQIWLFASPVIYPVSVIPEEWHIVWGLNPMVGVIEGFRWSLLGTTPSVGLTLTSMGALLLLLVTGLMYFAHVEQNLADVV